MTNRILLPQLLLSDNAATFFKHISEPPCAPLLIKENGSNVGRDIYNLSNILVLLAMLPRDAMEWFLGVLDGTSQAFLEKWLLGQSNIELTPNMSSGMMSWWIYWYIRLSTSHYLLPATPGIWTRRPELMPCRSSMALGVSRTGHNAATYHSRHFKVLPESLHVSRNTKTKL